MPVAIGNRPGLPVVAYRVGTHAAFKQSMVSALSDPSRPALRALTTRRDDDFTIALLDAWAVVAAVLTFYQERIINESYLRTATERGSVLQLARLIGYELRPGVAANAFLAFTLDGTPGSPRETVLETGVKIQSIPGPGEQAQIFETIEGIKARVEWNALKPRLSTPQQINRDTDHVYLQGTNTLLLPGDGILIVGDERDQNPDKTPESEQWDFRILGTVMPEPESDRTLIGWGRKLGKGSIDPARKNVKVYAFRLRAALFGYNAPDWLAVSDSIRRSYLFKRPSRYTASGYKTDKPATARIPDPDGRDQADMLPASMDPLPWRTPSMLKAKEF
jgi:hypothetical protein